MNKQLVARYLLDQVLSLVGAGVAMFWSAGRIDWWQAWAAIGVWVGYFAATDIILFRTNPDLMAERLAPPKGAKGWDTALVSILRLAQLARYVLAGLDLRYGWTVGFPIATSISALVISILGNALFLWAMGSNAYFSQVVRIQADRGHKVATNGPYRYLRHPGYAGLILSELALSTLLGSWWAIIAGGVCVLLIVLRTALEDRTLQAELVGYEEYSRQVRYRLIPGIW